MLNYILLLAQAQTGEPGQTSPQWMTFVMMGLVFVIFYFFMIRPQQKKQKELQQQREALKKGDKVVTAGGIYGIIKEVNETTFMLEISKEVIIKVDKASVFVATEDAHQAQSNEKK